MSFVSYLYKGNYRNVRDLMLVTQPISVIWYDTNLLYNQISQLLNQFETLENICKPCELCDTLRLKTITNKEKVRAAMLHPKPNAFVFIVNRN